MAGWSDYGDWTSADTLKFYPLKNIFGAITSAMAERGGRVFIPGETGINVDFYPIARACESIQNGITELIPKFANQTDSEIEINGTNNDIPAWNESAIAIKTTAGTRLPVPDLMGYGLQEWLYQQYEILNLLLWLKIPKVTGAMDATSFFYSLSNTGNYINATDNVLTRGFSLAHDSTYYLDWSWVDYVNEVVNTPGVYNISYDNQFTLFYASRGYYQGAMRNYLLSTVPTLYIKGLSSKKFLARFYCWCETSNAPEYNIIAYSDAYNLIINDASSDSLNIWTELFPSPYSGHKVSVIPESYFNSISFVEPEIGGLRLVKLYKLRTVSPTYEPQLILKYDIPGGFEFVDES